MRATNLLRQLGHPIPPPSQEPPPPPYTPQQNGPVESVISRAFKAGHAARLGVPQLYPDIHLEEIRGCTDAAGTRLWLKSLLWASECYNRAATSVNDEWLSPH